MSEADNKNDAALKEAECPEEGAQQLRLKVDEPTVDIEDTRNTSKAFTARTIRQGGWRSVMLPSDPEKMIEVSGENHVAMPIVKFYCIRLCDFVFDMVVTCMLSGMTFWGLGFLRVFSFSHMLDSIESYFASFWFWFAISSIFLLWVKYLRSLKDYADLGLRVVDRDGHSLTKKRAFMRSIAFCLTWFLFPLHLVAIAVGSRRLLHDVVTGTYMIGANENLKTTIYPPAPRWLAPMLVLACVIAVFGRQDFIDQMCQLEYQIVPSIFGRSSPAYLTYLKIRLSPSIYNIDKVSFYEARRTLSLFEDLVAEQAYLYDTQLKNGAGRLDVVPEAAHSVEYLYDVASVYAKVAQPGLAHEAICKMLKHPPAAIEIALGARFNDMRAFSASPSAAASIFLLRYGYTKMALAKAEIAQSDHQLEKNNKAFCADTQVIIVCLKLLRFEAHDRDAVDAAIESEQAEWKKRVGQSEL